MWYEREFKLSDYSFDATKDIEKYLGLPDGSIWDIAFSVEFGVSEYINATFHHEAEGGDMSEAKLTKASYVVKYYDNWYVHKFGYLVIDIPNDKLKVMEQYLPSDDKFYWDLI